MKEFSKDDIQNILARATQLQNEKSNNLYDDGLNTSELIHLAKEVGIDENSIKTAISEFENESFSSSFNWIDGTSMVQEITMLEYEMMDSDWDDIIQEIRKQTGGIGKDSKKSTSFEWEQRRETSYKHISLTPKNGKTRIQFVNNWRQAKVIITMMSIFFPIIISLIVLKSMGLKPFLGFGFIIGGITGYGVSKIILKNMFERSKKSAKSMFTEIRKRLEWNRKNKSYLNNEIGIEEESVNINSSSRIRS